MTSYVYDDLNRLTSESTSDSLGLTARTYYVYDADGNMTLRSRESFNTAAETDTPAVTLVSGFADLPNIDTFEYNDFGELTSAKVNGVNSTYTYRADGLRWYKTVNGTVTRHLWDGDDVIMDMTDGYTVTNEYTRGLGLIKYTDGASTQYYTRNRHGDTNHMIDAATSAISNTYKYDAYGNQESISETDTNPFRYSGEYYDAETGFIYLRARYYDSTTGRFISEDPARDGINWYAYCAGNPVMYVDPDGMKIVLMGGYYARQDMLSLLQKLTDRELFIDNEEDEQGNIIYFVSEVNPEMKSVKYHTGTKLIGELIEEDHIVSLGFATEKEIAENSEGFVEFANYRDATILGKGSDSVVKIRRMSADELTNSEFITEAGDKQAPGYILLGHELIHAHRGAKGRKAGYAVNDDMFRPGANGVFNGKYRYTTAEGRTIHAYAPEEELATVGLNYTISGDVNLLSEENIFGYSYITENMLRAEHNISKRIAY